jgi:hypothetical protein
MTKKIIQDFSLFESAYVNFESGQQPALNEGVLSGVMNFFSKVFGGRVSELNNILNKYKKNEATYWDKWAQANHEYNKAVAKRTTAEDPIDKQKHVEMMERANKLITQVTKTRHDVNDALDRQATFIIKDNTRLRDYWVMKKAKTDEQVANTSYSSLKKKVDSDTVDELYARVKETQATAKKAMDKMPKGSMSIGFGGKYEDLSDTVAEVPFSKFDIHDTTDFIFATDELWNDRVALMPAKNKEKLVDHLTDALDKSVVELAKQEKVYKGKINGTKDETEKKRLEKELKHTKEYADKDIATISNRITDLGGQIQKTAEVKPEEKLEEPEHKIDPDNIDAQFAAASDKISKKLSDVDETEIDFIIDDIISVYKKLPAESKDSEKKKNVKILQLIDFAPDIYKLRQLHRTAKKSTGPDLDEIYKAFKIEFPK